MQEEGFWLWCGCCTSELSRCDHALDLHKIKPVKWLAQWGRGHKTTQGSMAAVGEFSSVVWPLVNYFPLKLNNPNPWSQTYP